MLDLAAIDPANLSALSDDDLHALVAEVTAAAQKDRQENQILFYRPASPSALRVHRSTADVIGLFAGNRAGKTDTMFAEASMLSTGLWPAELDEVMRPKFRGPVRVRVDLQSLTTTLHSTILPKLQWFAWNGLKPQGGERGHWGWVPRSCLIGGEWDKSWSEKLRTLKVICRDPNDTARVMGHSVWQFVSHDQDAQDLASGEFDMVIHDEPPPWAHWRENQARVLSVNGRLLLGMTWPDDAAIPVDWIFDEVWEKGMPGPSKDPRVECIELSTLENPNIDQESVARQAAAWDATTRSVRIMGQPIRFSNRVHALFTDVEQVWSFAAGKPVVPKTEPGGHLVCPETGSDDLEAFCHVREFDHSRSWPTIFLLDPHPRKPHMMMWVQVRPDDDLDVIAAMTVDDTPLGLREEVRKFEGDMGFNVALRLGDPNMLRSPANADRSTLWIDEFRNAGLQIELADDSDVGRTRLNEYLKPDPRTRRPRIAIHRRCTMVIQQLKRFVWSDFKRQDDRDIKQVPRDKHDDFPALLRYCLNYNPNFRLLAGGAPIIRGNRRGAFG